MAQSTRSLSTEILRDYLDRVAFRRATIDRVGAEVELTPVAAHGDRIDIPGGLDRCDALWDHWPSDGDGPASSKEGPIPWRGGGLTREPGGQWEFSGPPLACPEETACAMAKAVALFRQEARAFDFDFLAAGFHPWATTDDLGLRKRSNRYVAMQSYLDTIGPSGRRMMRLTGSVQVAIDFLDEDGPARWELAQRLAPVLTAAFANSAVERGRPAAVACLRAEAWLGMDPARTGIPARFLDDPASDPIDQYLAFALDAPVMFVARDDGPYDVPDEPVRFADWMASGLPQGYPDLDDWETHLSTLFPEVRPRGYLEMRAMDAPGAAWVGVPILIVGHALREKAIRDDLLDLLRPDHDNLPELRVRAATHALADPTLRQLALGVFARVRAELDGPPGEVILAYEDRYLRHGLTPGEELVARIPPGGTLDLDTSLRLEDERREAAEHAASPTLSSRGGTSERDWCDAWASVPS